MGNKSSAEVNTAQAVHTPTPWHLESNQFMVWDGANIHEGKRAIASVYGTNAPEPMASEARANAEFIVRAVNSRAELVEACQFAASLEADLQIVPNALAEFCQRNVEASCYLSHLRGGILSSARKSQAALAKAEVQS